LDKGDIMIPKTLLMVFGELMNLGILNSFNFINLLLEIVNEAENTLSVSRDYYLHIAISVLPYVVEGLMKKSQIEYKNLIRLIKTLMAKRNLAYISITRPFKDSKPTDRLSEYWGAILEYIESENRGEIRSIPRPYQHFADELSGVTQVKKTTSTKLYFNNKVVENCVYQSPYRFQIFDEKILEEEVKSKLDLLILRETASDLLFLFQHNKSLALQTLFTLCTDYSCPSLITDAVISETFRLPNSDCRTIFYSSVLIGLGTDANLNATIKQAAGLLFDNVEKLDIELVDRFSSWLSHYMANFKYEWDWPKWVHVKDLDDDQMKKVFVKALLQKLVSLSFRTRIAEAVPAELHELLPAEPTVFYKYDNPKEANYADSEIIKDKLNQKLSAEDMIKLIQSDNNNLEASGEVLAEIFFDSLLQRGFKALSHFHTLVERYLPLLEFLFKKEADQFVLLDSVKRCWESSHFHQVTLIDALISYKLLNYKMVINWVFLQIERGEELSDYCRKYWEILLNTIVKILSQSDNAKSDLRKAKLLNQKDEIPKLQKKVENANEEEQLMFELVFRKFHKVLSESQEKDKFKFQMTFERFLQVARKYKRDIEPMMTKIEEDFAKLNVPELKNSLAAIKELK